MVAFDGSERLTDERSGGDPGRRRDRPSRRRPRRHEGQRRCPIGRPRPTRETFTDDHGNGGRRA
ncbi:hypothetical protein [Haloplanus pelagicus]|uniref:hypothetical protein n=1 Tax=Haloplanus pelagicus TaxID=2949995 RepID=UPI00203C99ED|nr:hypothetical protein [Haloplanus sp. HW8-1]